MMALIIESIHKKIKVIWVNIEHRCYFLLIEGDKINYWLITTEYTTKLIKENILNNSPLKMLKIDNVMSNPKTRRVVSAKSWLNFVLVGNTEMITKTITIWKCCVVIVSNWSIEDQSNSIKTDNCPENNISHFYYDLIWKDSKIFITIFVNFNMLICRYRFNWNIDSNNFDDFIID